MQHSLNQALSAGSSLNNKHIIEAKNYIRKAILSLENASKNETKKQNNQAEFDTQWGHLQPNIPITPMSKEAQMKCLSQLNAMISEEQKKLAEMEKQATPEDSGLFSE